MELQAGGANFGNSCGNEELWGALCKPFSHSWELWESFAQRETLRGSGPSVPPPSSPGNLGMLLEREENEELGRRCRVHLQNSRGSQEPNSSINHRIQAWKTLLKLPGLASHSRDSCQDPFSMPSSGCFPSCHRIPQFPDSADGNGAAVNSLFCGIPNPSQSLGSPRMSRDGKGAPGAIPEVQVGIPSGVSVLLSFPFQLPTGDEFWDLKTLGISRELPQLREPMASKR